MLLYQEVIKNHKQLPIKDRFCNKAGNPFPTEGYLVKQNC